MVEAIAETYKILGVNIEDNKKGFGNHSKAFVFIMKILVCFLSNFPISAKIYVSVSF